MAVVLDRRVVVVNELEPQPGEVWIITDPQYGPEKWQAIHHHDRPFIVTHISPLALHWLRCSDLGAPVEGYYSRGKWDWSKHAARLWPAVPSWPELEAQARVPDDLRAQPR